MTTQYSISIGVYEGFSWIRCHGKGSFQNSSFVQEFGNSRITNGERCLVIDLSECTGMDSTFMGVLTSLARRLLAIDGGKFQLIDPGERNLRSLEDLGLHVFMEIDPPLAPWRGRVDQIRQELKPYQISPTTDSLQRARHVLHAHQTLSDVNCKNQTEFSNVVKMLENEVNRKQRNHPKPEG